MYVFVGPSAPNFEVLRGIQEGKRSAATALPELRRAYGPEAEEVLGLAWAKRHPGPGALVFVPTRIRADGSVRAAMTQVARDVYGDEGRGADGLYAWATVPVHAEASAPVVEELVHAVMQGRNTCRKRELLAELARLKDGFDSSSPAAGDGAYVTEQHAVRLVEASGGVRRLTRGVSFQSRRTAGSSDARAVVHSPGFDVDPFRGKVRVVSRYVRASDGSPHDYAVLSNADRSLGTLLRGSTTSHALSVLEVTSFPDLERHAMRNNIDPRQQRLVRHGFVTLYFPEVRRLEQEGRKPAVEEATEIARVVGADERELRILEPHMREATRMYAARTQIRHMTASMAEDAEDSASLVVDLDAVFTLMHTLRPTS